MTTPDFEALKRGWNDAVMGLPYDNAMSLGPHTMAYEMGRQLVAELWAAAGNGDEPPSAWTDHVPEAFHRAMRLYRETPSEMNVAQRLEQEFMHRGAVQETGEVLYLPARKRRRAVRLRW